MTEEQKVDMQTTPKVEPDKVAPEVKLVEEAKPVVEEKKEEPAPVAPVAEPAPKAE